MADNTQFGTGAGATGALNESAGFTGDTGSTGTTGAESATSARGIADMARNAASQAQQKAGEQVRSSIDKGRTRAADTLQEFARTLMGQGSQENAANQVMTRAGEQVQRAADYLQNTDMRQMVTHTEDFARRQPALFLGGAFALGVLAARFLKSSRQDSDGAYDASGRLYDRETALSSYSETGYTASTTGPLGDDEMEWPSGGDTLGGSLGGSTGGSTGFDSGSGTGGSGSGTLR